VRAKEGSGKAHDGGLSKVKIERRNVDFADEECKLYNHEVKDTKEFNLELATDK
jgi:hypothetical protein